MASVVQICNLGLAKVGDEQITSLTENKKAARLCNLVYEPLRDSVLRAHFWNFAVDRAALAKSTDTPPYEYSAKFALPTDFLRLIDTDLLDSATYKVEGKFILADTDSLSVRYVKRVEDPNEFDWLFIEALAARLAAELAIALTDSRVLSVDLFNLYSTKIMEARTADAQEGSPDDIISDTWLNARLLYVNPVN